MAPEDQEEGTKEERLKAALWYNVGQMIDVITLEQNVNTTPQFIAGLSEMLWAQIELASRDTESFAKHAGRDIIRAEDILLLARRSEGLQEVLQKSVDMVKQKSNKG